MYTSYLVSNHRDEMNYFVMGVSDDHLEVCHLAMLHDNMDMSCLMVDSQQVKESRIKMKIKDANRERSHEEGTSNGKLQVQDKPKLK